MIQRVIRSSAVPVVLGVALALLASAVLLWPQAAHARPPRPTLGTVTLSDASFYGGAGSSGQTTLTYTVNRTATISVVVRNSFGSVTRTLLAPTVLGLGTYTASWDGTGDGGVNQAEGAYSIAVSATTSTGDYSETSRAVDYALTPVASEASLGVGAAGGYVLHTVTEQWDEALWNQTIGNYYYDGQVQPWEFASMPGVAMTLFVGTDAAAQEDTSYGGSTEGTSDARGIADLDFPPDLAWLYENGVAQPLYYSLRLSYGGSTRWYPATGRYPLGPPVDADGHVEFIHLSDIQVPYPSTATPDLAPDAMTGPYTAIPMLSRSLGWSAVLSGLLQETPANLVLVGGDAIERGLDEVAPDNGGTQYRTLFDNQQTYGPADEWSLSKLAAQVPLAMVPGNHDDLGVVEGTQGRWSRWVNSPSSLPYYSFDEGDVHFILLNTYDASSDPAANYRSWIGFQSDQPGGSRTVTVDGVPSTFTNSAQADWLISAIATDKPWTVVVMHHPLFDGFRTATNAYNDANNTGAVTTENAPFYGERDRLLAFFAAHGVDVVLGGHNHNYRRHMEKVRSADGLTRSTMMFVTQLVAGAAPANRDTVNNLPFIDWVDLDGDGVPDAQEPVATAGNSTNWDAAAFGQQNVPYTDSGYNGTPDMFHATGQEYDDGLSFSYSVFKTGQDAQGQPTMTLNVKFVSWNGTAHVWNPWTVYDSVQVQEVEPGMVADRLSTNTAPVAVDDSYATDEDTALHVAAKGVLANDSDAQNDPLTAVLVTGPSHGTLTLNADGGFDYTPAADYNGVDSFTYKANDSSVDSNVATVSITVNAVNDAPVFVGWSSTLNTAEGKQAQNSGTVLDVDGDAVTVTSDVGVVAPPDPAWVWTFTPPDGPAVVPVTLTADDHHGGTTLYHFTLNVTNAAPVVNAGPDVRVDAGTTISSSGSFIDAGADTWTGTVDYGDGSGQHALTLNPDKTFQLSHVYALAGRYTITVTVTDDDGGVGSDTVRVTVQTPHGVAGLLVPFSLAKAGTRSLL